MAYTAPRGPCSQKLSMLTSCPCYRFMIHPMKASTSFDCDGCGHHASYHRLQNEQEEETAKRWKVEQAEKTKEIQRRQWRSVEEVMEELAPKRKRIAAPPQYGENGTAEESELVEIIEDRRGERGDEREREVEREVVEKTTVVAGKKRKGRA